ncbi:MAG: S8 family serine peptidase [Microcoleaceae cyanobacterium]
MTSPAVNQLIQELEASYEGFEVIGSAPEYYFLEAFFPIEFLDDLNGMDQIMGVIPASQAITSTGLVTSQADFVHESDRVRSTLPEGFDGTGLTVGIMSDSFDISSNGSAAEDIASKDLPENINILQEGPSGGLSDEGRAMAQLIHDLAPGADLAFSSVAFGETNFAQQIRDLADPDLGSADILVDDISYVTEPFFQDGIIAQAIDEVVTNQGVAYFSAAGNRADQSYESTNFEGTPDSEGLFNDLTFHDFDPTDGVDTRQLITLSPGRTLFSLQWDDPFYTLDGVDTDLGVLLVEPGTSNVLVEADSLNVLTQTPLEVLDFINSNDTPIQVEVMIPIVDGPQPERIKYVNFLNPITFNEFDTQSNTIVGHSAATNAMAVGAVPFFTQTVPTPFTSTGPTTFLFKPDGTPLDSPEIRQTPDIAGIDGADNTFFGNDIDNNGFPNIFGTSASAPHVAAIAALILEANPDFTPQEVYDRLQETAIDLGEPGDDTLTGAGLANAYDAIFGPPESVSLPFEDDFEDGDLSLAYTTNSNGAGRIQVTEGNGPIDTKHLTLDSSFDLGFSSSLNEVILNVDTTDFANIELSFDQREFEDEDDPMPATFTGSVNADGVALSTDGINWIRLISLTGSDSTETYQTQTFDLSEIAADNNLTLDSEIQIKFQQFGNFPIDSDGFAFDNISVTGTPILIAPVATAVDDVLLGTDENDTIAGLMGDDRIEGNAGNDLLRGDVNNRSSDEAGGNDTISGGAGNDRIGGKAGDDQLFGNEGRDRLWGDQGDDTLRGGLGNDELHGDSGNLSGGADLFILAADEGTDTIVDFEPGLDLIGLAGDLTFSELSIVQVNGNTRILVGDETLAILENVTEPLTDQDFTTI